jgi:hypothetical protein
LELAATLVWNYPTVAQIAAYLAERLGLSFDGEVSHLVADKLSPSLPHANGTAHPTAHPTGPAAKRSAGHSTHRHSDRLLTGKGTP